jgi:SEC-C motif-containing protein
MSKKRRRRRRRGSSCPCGSGDAYGKCCGPYHRGDADPETPEELMRSRYAAYAKGDVDYIVETTDPDGEAWTEPESEWRDNIREFTEGYDFQGVEIRDSGVDGETGWVEFYARLRAGRRDASFEERSRFARRDGRWLYSGGDLEE